MYFEYNKLINYYYYKENVPIGKIVHIRKNENNYTIFFIPNNKYSLCNINFNEETISEIELLKLYKDFLLRQERYNILTDRQVESLYHFTKAENLESILQRGLYSKNILKDLNIDYKHSDDYRLDRKENFICNSMSFPNYKMFFAKRMENTEQKWVLIRINKEILLHKTDTEFYETNCASNIYTNDNTDHTSNESLIMLFNEKNRDPKIPSYYPTNPQAEILIKNVIKTAYIDSVITKFNDEKIKSLARNVHIDYDHDTKLFSSRMDYRNW